jgi:hypothetical protein
MQVASLWHLGHRRPELTILHAWCIPGPVLGGELNHPSVAAKRLCRIARVLIGPYRRTRAGSFGRHQAAELVQNAATERFALRRKLAALGVGKAQAPAAELLAQNAVLFPERYSRIATCRQFTQPANTSIGNEAVRPTCSAILPRGGSGSTDPSRER